MCKTNIYPVKSIVLTVILYFFIFVSLAAVSCGGGGGDPDDETPTGGSAKWTYMVFIAGDNNLSTAAIGDINEMETVGSTGSVNIVVQAEFSQVYSVGFTVPENTVRGKITKDSDTSTISSTLTDIGNQNMGKKETLTEFIKWATTHYPADKYALVLWDHGAGWKADEKKGGAVRGALEDATSGSFMSLPDLALAVKDSGAEIDLIDFDACLMAMYEVAYEFNGLTDYMVFSEEVEPGEGNPYDTILAELVKDSDMTAKTFAGHVCSKFKTFYQLQERTYITKSAVDMAYISSLHEKLRGFVSVANENFNTERPNIQMARDASISYDYPENHDIESFLDELNKNTTDSDIKSQISAIKDVLDDLIISNEVYSPETGDPIIDSCGLAIYLPKKDQVPDSEFAQYSQLAINQSRAEDSQSWAGFVGNLINGDTSLGLSHLNTKPGNFVILLEWDTDADLDLVVWEPDGTFAAPYIGASSPNGFLSEDSATSGEPVEYYAAAGVVEEGDYDILIEYYSDGPLTTGTTNVGLYLLDPEEGIDDFKLIGQRTMDLSNIAPSDWYNYPSEVENVILGMYSDWWIPYVLTRSTGSGLHYDRIPINIKISNKISKINNVPSKASHKQQPISGSADVNLIREQINTFRK